jgi:hypothetical protein
VTSRAWRVIAGIVPIAALAVDLLLFPRLIEYRSGDVVDVAELIQGRVQRLATLKGHDILVSMDDLASRNAWTNVTGSRNALVVSAFRYEDSEGLYAAALLQAFLARVEQESTDSKRRIFDALERAQAMQPGTVVSIDLHLPPGARQALPLDRLYVVVISHGQSRHQTGPQGDIARGLTDAFLRATDDRIEELALPCIGYNWRDKNSISFSDFFTAVFDAIPAGRWPPRIRLSLYSRWPTFVLDDAVASLDVLRRRTAPRESVPVPARLDLRLALLTLSLCLIASSRHATMSPKNALIVSGAFLASTTGLWKTIDFLTPGYNPLFLMSLKAATAIGASLLLPTAVAWNPKQVFGRNAGS